MRITSERARRRKIRTLTALSATLAAAALSGVAVQTATATPAPHQVPVKHLCSAPSHRGQMACMSLV
ncbi:MAG TPA: hypothetical protein VFB40_23380, partial [Actinocrinis sp.]